MPKPAKPSAKREAILDAAQRAFLEEGYAATSMDGVATGASVSKATIYAHFESKEQLFAAVMHRGCDSSFALVPPDESADARTALTVTAQRLMALLMAPKALALYRVVVAEASRSPDLARTYYENGPVRGKAAITAVIALLQRRGELAPAADAGTITDQLIGMLRAETFQRALLGLPDGRSLEDTIAAMVETLVQRFGGTAPR